MSLDRIFSLTVGRILSDNQMTDKEKLQLRICALLMDEFGNDIPKYKRGSHKIEVSNDLIIRIWIECSEVLYQSLKATKGP